MEEDSMCQQRPKVVWEVRSRESKPCMRENCYLNLRSYLVLGMVRSNFR